MSSVTDLINSLKGNSGSAAPVSPVAEDGYIEKLASAVEFIVSGADQGQEKVAKATPIDVETINEAIPLNLGEILRRRLQEKAVVTNDEAGADRDLRKSVLSKLLRGRLAAAVDAPEQEEKDDVSAVVEELFYGDDSGGEETNDSSESSESSSDTESSDVVAEEKAEDSPVEKTAGISDLSLADMIEGAVSGGESESAPAGVTKTAQADSDERPKAKEEVTSALKSRLLAAVGRG